jgi:outer membrane immunogenic protein
MKKLLIAGIASVSLVAAPTMAADLATKARPPLPPPIFSWTGCYVGLHVGGGIHHSEWIYDPEQGVTSDGWPVAKPDVIFR